MALCNVNWSEKWKELFEAIKRATTEEIQNAWIQSIKDAGCENDNIDTLLKLLLYILNSKDSRVEYIKYVSYHRLDELIREKRQEMFNEEELNLPLS
jgi:hypothetical protein